MMYRQLILAGACFGLCLMASADPIGQTPDTDHAAAIEDLEAQMEQQTDDFMRAAQPSRQWGPLAESLTAIDPRFAVAIDRLAVQKMATPGTRDTYLKQIAKGWFDGSFADFGRWSAVEALYSPVYGPHAAVVDNPPAYSGYAALFSRMDTVRADAGKGPAVGCGLPGNVSDKDMQALADWLGFYAEVAVDFAVSFPEDHSGLLARAGIWNQDVSTERSILLAHARSSLLDSHGDDPYAPDYPFQGTALAHLLGTKSLQTVGPFYGAAAPEEVKGDIPPPGTSSGD